MFLRQPKRVLNAIRVRRNRRVLIVEDDGVLSAVMRETLRDDGYDADVAPDGAAALEVVRDQAPDLILVDLQLPLIDGPSFVERYRRAVTTAVNIVVVSGRADAQEIAQSIGADAYLAKPFERDDLLTAVEWSLTAR